MGKTADKTWPESSHLTSVDDPDGYEIAFVSIYHAQTMIRSNVNSSESMWLPISSLVFMEVQWSKQPK